MIKYVCHFVYTGGCILHVYKYFGCLQYLFKPEKYQRNMIISYYGPNASGKTTFAKCEAVELAKQGNKIAFLDSENGFSVDRIKQIAGNDYKNCLDNILVFKIKSFKEQQEAIKNLEKIKNKISLVIVDSFNSYYRRLFNSKPALAKSMLNSQLKILEKLNIRVILTNQVFDNLNGEVTGVGSYFTDKVSDEIIELKKEPRKWINKKTKEEKGFEIISSGIFWI